MSRKQKRMGPVGCFGQIENIKRQSLAYDAGFIDESLAWNYICSAGQQCIQAFNDWTEVGKSFLLGQAMEATEKRKQELYIRLYRQATENPNSPWKKRTLK